MQLIEVNHIRVQAAQTGFTFFANVQKVFILTKCYAFLRFVDVEAKFCCDDGFVAFAFESTRKYSFTVTRAIVCGSVEEIDAEIQRSMDGADRFVVIYITPSAWSIQPIPSTADCPATQPHWAYLKTRSSQRPLECFCCCSHSFSFQDFSSSFSSIICV